MGLWRQVPECGLAGVYRKDLITNASVWHRLRPTTTSTAGRPDSADGPIEGKLHLPGTVWIWHGRPAGLKDRRSYLPIGSSQPGPARPERLRLLWILRGWMDRPLALGVMDFRFSWAARMGSVVGEKLDR